MTILFTTFAYYPETSGVPIVVKYLAEGLASKGHKVIVVTRSVEGRDDNETVAGVEIHRFLISTNIFKRFIGNIDEYVSFVKNCPKDVIVMECLQCFTTDILLPHIDEFNCRVFVHSHGTPGQNNMHFFEWKNSIRETVANTYNYLFWRNYYKNIIPKYAHKIRACIALSIYDKSISYLTKYFREIKILENAADDVFFETHEGSPQIDLNTKYKDYLLCVANYISSKNQLEVLEEYAKIKTKEISLVFIGGIRDKEYHKRLVERTEHLLSKNPHLDIRILSGIERSYIPAIVANAKLFVFASEMEQYPMVLVEAMASGTPFICSDVGNARILPGGVTYTKESPISIMVDLLLANKSLYFEFQKLGRMYASDNNVRDKIVAQLERIISE